MPTLLSFSTELLLSVLLQLPCSATAPLALTCGRINELANRRLYESVYFWGTGNTDTCQRRFVRGLNGDYFSRQIPPLCSTRIYDLDTFTQAIENSEFLRSLVRCVELTWGNCWVDFRERHVCNDPQEDSSTSDSHNQDSKENNRILRVLKSLKISQLQSLHLSPPGLYSDIPFNIPITSLTIRHRGHPGWAEEECAKDLDQLYKLCCIASLKDLSIDGWLYWGGISTATLTTNPERGKSQITTLSIVTMGCPGLDLQEAMSWFTALRKFSFECFPENGTWYSLSSCPSSGEFVYALQHIRETLEGLSIRCKDGNTGANDDQPISLLRFPLLKHVCIRYDFLIMSRGTREERIELHQPGEALLIQDLYEVLPPSLVELHLEIDGIFEPYKDLEPGELRRELNGGLSEDWYDLMNQLEGLALHKSEFLPKLGKVLFGHPSHAAEYPLWGILENCDSGRKVMETYADAGIELHCWKQDELPLSFDK